MPEDVRRRLPFIEKSISEISQEDVRVRIIGTVIDKQENRIVLDDGTGKIDITFDETPSIEINELVRVMGRVIPMENGFELQGEIIQDIAGLDLDLYKKVNGLMKQINIL